MRKPSRGVAVPADVAEAVRALVVARGAERATRLIGLSPLAVTALAAGAFVQPETLARAAHYLATGQRKARAVRPPPPRAPVLAPTSSHGPRLRLIRGGASR